MEFLLSQEDAHLCAIDWNVNAQGYVYRYLPRDIDGRRQIEMLHRRIANPPPGFVVDHINGNPGDNRRENLRVCAQADNLKNRKVHANNLLGVKGVFAARGGFVAQIRSDRKKYYLGQFDTIPEAKAAYDAAAKRLHGAFARLD